MAIITLSTDLGVQDYLVGAIKGQLLSENKSIQLIDITHHLIQTNYPHAAYSCSSAFKHFPEQTIHIVLLDIYSAKDLKILVAVFNNQIIICPDNGILTLITQTKPELIFSLSTKKENTFLQITQTIAKAVGNIIIKKPLNEIGITENNIVERSALKPTIGNNWIEGQILFVDNFENVIINITKEVFDNECRGRKFKIHFKRNETINTIQHNYASVHETEKLAFFNSAGYLEIAINKGNIAGLFGLNSYNENMNQHAAAMQNKWFYQTVQIIFED
ncbi:MAG: SAM-dependent chlorinase/fluorinase [Bacteroidetes bacterium]|nr:SAM-dependent chlorinase/fluorinase [Bacteroidota bacterium]MBS1590726.1 SAM-dependent chlorinase/fluorinase [Bacteroidota bacterium]